MKKIFDLEDRLVDFAILVWDLSEKVENTPYGKYIVGQILRCSASPALNYAEAQSAESQKDFIHKIKIVLKELKETKVCLKIIKKKPLVKDPRHVIETISETDQLLAIFTKSIKTASLKLENGRKS